MSSTALGRACVVTLGATLVACATGRPTSWDDDEKEGVANVKNSPVHFPATTVGTSLRDTPRSVAAVSATDSRDLELLLIRFTAQRKAIAKDNTPAPSWPPRMEALWLDLLSRLEIGLIGATDVPVRLLIQARVTTEAERDFTERRFGPTPAAVTEKVDRLFGRIAWLMQRSRPEGQRRSVATSELEWPVTPVVVTSGFGYRRDPFTAEIRFHSGVDLHGTEGDLVSAAGPGRVVYAGWLSGYGRTVIVQHPGAYQTVYGHLSRILVPGEVEVDAGSPLGFVGSTGRSTGAHLHFEVRREGAAIDPHEAIGLQVVSLLP